MKQFDTLEIQKNIEEKRLILGKKLEEFLLKKLSIFGQFLSRLFTSKYSAFFGCLIIISISIIASSTRDIGHDSAVYLENAEKMFNGGKYYQDFFENNLPLSFIFAIIPYFFAKLFHGNSIIFFQAFIDLVGILSLYSSAQILKRSEIYENKPIFNVIIFAFAAGFFLRIYTLQFNELGTKSTYFLSFAYPYISYHCLRKLRNRDQIISGILAALLFCLKPNYGILVIVFEVKKLLENKSLKSGFCLRNYTTLFVLICYLLFLINCFPDYIAAIPAFSKLYFHIELLHLNEFSKEDLLAVILLISLCFSKIKNFNFLQPFFLTSLAITLIITSEIIGGHDQRFAFYSLSLPLIALSTFLIIKNNYINWRRDWVFILSALVVPQVDPGSSFFVALNICVFWPLFAIFFSLKNRKFLQQKSAKISNIFLPRNIFSWLCLLALAAINYAIFFQYSKYFATFILFAVIFIYMVNFYQKIHEKINSTKEFSTLSISIITLAISYIIALHLASIFNFSYTEVSKYNSPNHTNDQMIKIIKNYTDEDDQITIISSKIYGTYPVLNYTKKPNPLPFPLLIQLSNKTSSNAALEDVETYMLNRIKQQLDNPKNKLVFVERKTHFTINCSPYFIEYYAQDPEFKKIFFTNYKFLNRIIITRPTHKEVIFFNDDSQLKSETASNYIERDIEVYVRK